jgi:hypothetical protein
MMTRQAHLRAGLVGVAAALSVLFALANDGAAQGGPRPAGTGQDGSTVPIAQAMSLEAQRNATAAAEAFLMIGDVLNAAHQFIDAATVAQERKRHEEALRFVQRAECLSQSPLLSLAQAELIRGRIQPTGRVLLVRR